MTDCHRDRIPQKESPEQTIERIRRHEGDGIAKVVERYIFGDGKPRPNAGQSPVKQHRKGTRSGP